MYSYAKDILSKNIMRNVAWMFFLVLTFWWISLNPFSRDINLEHAKYVWGSFYQIIAIWGGISGLIISRSLGGFRSFIGRSMFLLSLGLLFQSIGQSFYSYYNLFTDVQAPYPSLGDIGYFGSVILYILGVFSLIKISGFKISENSLFNKIQAILIPLIMLVLSYNVFLQSYEFDWANKLKIFLDFGYPFGQAIYVSVALLVLSVSRKSLGGVLRKPVLLLVFALIVQYFCDSNFLYHANAGTWHVGSVGDYLYTFSYFVMALALIYIGSTFDKIKTGGLEDVVESSESDDGLMGATSVLSRVVVEIIKRQERIAGQIAWEEAKNIEGLIVVDQQKEQISFTDNSNENLKKIIDKLVEKYKSIFGGLAVQVSKDAAKHFIAELPEDEIPDSLR